MIILISGASHTGKTNLAQKLMEKYSYPYMSIDHLKMGLIRTGICPLSPEDSEEKITAYFWPVIREIIKTAIENKQNLIIEGCFIPPTYKKDFSEEYILYIKYICLVMSEDYINKHFYDIKKYGSIIEERLDDNYCTKELVLEDNKYYYNMCMEYNLNYVLIDDKYEIDFEV